MSEYIYCSNGEPLVNERGEISLARAGEVVRCRDCKYARKTDKTDAGMDCDRHILCARFNPDGFCAWAEKQEMK